MSINPAVLNMDNPDDLKPLSPSMFLQEIREFGVPDYDMLCREKLNKKWRYKQKIIEDLRKRFRTEYLGQLRLKNDKKENRKIEIGDIVLIGDDIHKRIDWPLARVMSMIPGRDGLIRVLILKTEKGVLKRPIQRVYPLEIARQELNINRELHEKANPEEFNKDIKEDNFEKKPIEHFVDKPENRETNVTTKSGRIVRKPERLEYI